MTGLIGEVLPLAVGIAISPIPIIATILLLLAPRGRAASLSFLVGWVLGILGSVLVFAALSDAVLGGGSSGGGSGRATARIVLGVVLLAVAWRRWRRRSEGADSGTPRWLAAIDSISPGRAFVMALLLSAANPKNVVLAMGAGLAIGHGDDIATMTVGTAVFVVVAAATVAGPVIAHLVAGHRIADSLGRLRTWLTQNNDVIMTVVLVVIGVSLVGKGLSTW